MVCPKKMQWWWWWHSEWKGGACRNRELPNNPVNVNVKVLQCTAVVAVVLQVNALLFKTGRVGLNPVNALVLQSILQCKRKRQGRVEPSECPAIRCARPEPVKSTLCCNTQCKTGQGWTEWMQGSSSYSGASVRPSLHASSCFFLSTPTTRIELIIINIITEALFFFYLQILSLLESQYTMSHMCLEPGPIRFLYPVCKVLTL